jgi:alpha-tubulin suppressor-like RCC1 family protein
MKPTALALTLTLIGCGSRSELIVPPPPLVLALGASHSCARMPDHTARCWGRNDHGELGDGTTTTRTRPTQVLALTDVAQIAIGRSHACALQRDGRVMCWGDNSSGMLGDGTMNDHLLAAPVAGLADVTRITVGGDDTSCAVLRDGTVRCWGNDSWRAATIPDGDGGLTFDRDDNDICLVPSRPDAGPSGFSCRMRPRVIRGVDDAIDVAINDDSACALRRDGTVRCWGTIDHAPFRIASIELAAVPLRGLVDVVQIAMTELSGCALDRAGVVRCWGNIGGNHVDPDGPVPQRVDALDGSMAIAIELGAVCALRGDRSVRCFANGGFAPPAVVDLPALQGATSIAAGYSHLCATFGGDEVRCFGENGFGQLGIGTMDPQTGVVSVRW